MKQLRSILAACILGSATMAFMTSCQGEKQVIIYSNADDEAIAAMGQALDKAGYKDKYMFTTFSTSELGGKVIAEGKNIEADMLTLSSYYLDSAQSANKMFLPLTFAMEPLKPVNPCFGPITGQEGAIFINTKVIEDRGIAVPKSLKDLSKPEYKGLISIPNIKSSSTAWLMVQALVNAYGEEETRQILKAMIDNAGPHLENSGSAPLKKLRAGEVAIAFGLRQQAVADKKKGLPIDYVDPTEGTFSLMEAVAIPDKGDNTNPETMKMAEIMIREGRKELIKTYPVPLFHGEQAVSDAKSPHQKTFPQPLTVELLKKHQSLMDN
ncbi:extracellular solute-binding protein [Akkermansia sp. N21169]|uniref:extracellular solute-binding protein n=1 Tax=Akkermansia sp. N21169 TaxID=3040765 RepID=UPI00244EED0F|nr:extracellular solute-binding protein [Akkermansia sp. N21169]MDH3069163.1 extracellular solute-binding protein [Akkermansia sp. N21169]